ncbi:tRNA pseudouridine(38-40) synthase TruA, partial [Shewanella algae]
TALHGSQFQVGVRTVQSELESAISTYLRREKTTVIFSGRTDAGVHAGGQVAHFDTHDLQPEFDLWRFVWAVNGILKSDISV